MRERLQKEFPNSQREKKIERYVEQQEKRPEQRHLGVPHQTNQRTEQDDDHLRRAGNAQEDFNSEQGAGAHRIHAQLVQLQGPAAAQREERHDLPEEKHAHEAGRQRALKHRERNAWEQDGERDRERRENPIPE